MGQEIVEEEEVETQEEETTDEQESEEQPGEGEEGEKPTGNQIILDGEDEEESPTSKKGSQFGIRKRINKLNAKVETEREGRTAAEQALEIERKKNEVLQLALQSNGKGPAAPVAKPNPDDFDGGTHDPEYLDAFDKWQESLIESKVAEKVQNLTKQTSAQGQQEAKTKKLEEAQFKHYEEVQALDVADYSDVEDKALEILGTDYVNHIIENFPKKSPLLLYHLGKKPEKCEEIKGLLDTNAIQGVAKLGALLERLKLKPKTNDSPGPDEEIEGGGGSSLRESYQAKVDRLRKKSQQGDADAVKRTLELKKEAKAKGITLE